MMKNKKGFTLIELLAVLVILGILSVLSLPSITRIINSSRNKMYITDAKKLVSQAEYQMRARNNEIVIPNPGHCIVISLSYLDSSVFSSGPNGGTYDLCRSYVVVSNNDDGKLDYSVSLVEKYKDNTYKGLPLVKNNSLYTSNITSKITSSNFIFAKNINVNNINNQIGTNYVSIDGKYLGECS